MDAGIPDFVASCARRWASAGVSRGLTGALAGAVGGFILGAVGGVVNESMFATQKEEPYYFNARHKRVLFAGLEHLEGTEIEEDLESLRRYRRASEGPHDDAMRLLQQFLDAVGLFYRRQDRRYETLAVLTALAKRVDACLRKFQDDIGRAGDLVGVEAVEEALGNVHVALEEKIGYLREEAIVTSS